MKSLEMQHQRLDNDPKSSMKRWIWRNMFIAIMKMGWFRHPQDQASKSLISRIIAVAGT